MRRAVIALFLYWKDPLDERLELFGIPKVCGDEATLAACSTASRCLAKLAGARGHEV